jgi:competence protein ComEA
MKRIALSLSAAALVLCLGAIAYADDAPATTPSSTPAPAAEAKPMHKAHHKGAAKAAAAAIDLNSATKEQLMTLPGIDDATADKIIAARPFAKRMDLVSKSVVSKTEYSKIKSKVVAKKSS